MVRTEEPADRDAVRRVNVAMFDRPYEPGTRGTVVYAEAFTMAGP